MSVFIVSEKQQGLPTPNTVPADLQT